MAVSRQTRSISWSAPADVRVAVAGMDVAGYLTAVARGEVPNSPAIELLGMRLTSFGVGSAEVSFQPEEYHVNFVGAVHGGVISAVLDSCIGYAVNTTLGRDEAFVTSQLNVQFIRGIRAGAEVAGRTGPVAPSWRAPGRRRGVARRRRGHALRDGDRHLHDFGPARDVRPDARPARRGRHFPGGFKIFTSAAGRRRPARGSSN